MDKNGTNKRDAKQCEDEARSNDVKVVLQTERDVGEKDRVESEIAVATFAELVSVTSIRLRLRNAEDYEYLYDTDLNDGSYQFLKK